MLCAAVVLAGVGLLLLDLRNNALDQAGRETASLGHVLAERSAGSLQAVDAALRDTTVRLDAAAAESGEPFGLRMGHADIRALLREQLGRLPQVEAFAVLDHRRQVLNDTHDGPARPLEAASLDAFDDLRTAGSEVVQFGPAEFDPASGAWTLLAARRINDDAGQFAGLVVGAVSMRAMQATLDAGTARPGTSVVLARLDGKVLATFPLDPSRTVADTSLAGDGQAYLVSVHPLGDLPLALKVRVTERSVLAGWRQQAAAILGGASLAAIGMAALLRTIIRQFGWLHSSRAALAQRTHQLEQVRLRLERQGADLAQTAEALRASERRAAENAGTLQTTLENIDQGLLMVGADHRVAAFNQRVLDMLDLPRELLARQPSFDDVLAVQWRNDEFATAKRGVVRFVRSGGLASSPHLYEHIRPNGRVLEIRSLPLPGGCLVQTYSDITDRKSAEAHIRFIAHHDGLTMLANRGVLQDHLVQAVATCKQTGQGLALLLLDLDRFKPINDTYGHAVGDLLLMEVANRMRGLVRDEDLVARMGGDEFAIVQTAAAQPKAAAGLAQRLIDSMAKPFFLNGHRVTVSFSIGIGIYPASGADAAELQRNAEFALYRAKGNGRNGFEFFHAEIDLQQQSRFQLEQDLRDTVGFEAFHLMYQPISDARTGAVLGFETLLRWTHPTRGAIGPEEFVGVAELNGLIVPLGRWVMETACAEAADWAPHLRLAVNLSPLQFRQANLVDQIVGVLRRTGLAPHRLEFEVTEGVLLEDSGQVRETMVRLQALGVSMVLDDFGTGHASLSYLQRFPFDKMKIDKYFVQHLQDDRVSLAIVEAVLLLGRRLGLDVVAEGVETQAQLDRLRDLHCPLVQGFLIGRPMTAGQARVFDQSNDIGS